MRKPRQILFLASLAAVLGSCLNGGDPAEREITWRLSDSLRTFDSVLILISDASGRPLDTVFQGKMNYPDTLKPFAVPAETPENFQVQILGLSSQGDTQFVSVIRVNNGRASALTPFRQLLLDSLKVSPGVLFPAFTPLDLKSEYQVTGLPSGTDSLSITAFSVDSVHAILQLNGISFASGVPDPQPLVVGDNFFRIKVLARDSSGWTMIRIKAYHL